MNISDSTFKRFPFLFYKKKRTEELKLNQMLEERFSIVTDTLKVEGVTKPKLKITSSEVSSYRNNTVYVSCSKIFESKEKQFVILDHELAHYIQHSKNPYIKKFYPLEFFSFFYWSLTGKLRWGLRLRAFEEGLQYIQHI